jgi:hypothetical protein
MRALGHEHDQLYNTKALDMLPMCLSVGARQFQPEAAHLWFKLAHGDIAAVEAEPWLARLWLCNGDKCRGARKGPAVAAHGPTREGLAQAIAAHWASADLPSIWHVMASKGEPIQMGPAASANRHLGGSQTRSAFPNSTCARRDAHSSV